MKKIKHSIVTILFIVFNLFGQENNNEFKKLLNVFPKIESGFSFRYIKLPQIKLEKNYKIELFVGIQKLLDCNNHFLQGNIEEKNLNGYQYPYYVVESKGEIFGTKMACLNQKETKKIVNISSKIIGYNSKLPIVVYLPKNMKLTYRIWKTDENFYKSNFSK